MGTRGCGDRQAGIQTTLCYEPFAAIKAPRQEDRSPDERRLDNRRMFTANTILVRLVAMKILPKASCHNRIPCRRRIASSSRTNSRRSSSNAGRSFNSSHNLIRRWRSWRFVLRRPALSLLEPIPESIKKLQLAISSSILSSFFCTVFLRGEILLSRRLICCSRSKMAPSALRMLRVLEREESIVVGVVVVVVVVVVMVVVSCWVAELLSDRYDL
mmetsp:Transcript_21446/g.36533  ORF Transcript_21446/g.36533 Transcript_21446/m.36533 type:complete len:215 (+) Transcript_21446:957-1601(+)